jgi:hypothetical protein
VIALLLGVVATAVWPGLCKRPAWPVHLLRGESWWTDLALALLVAGVAVGRVAGLLVVRTGPQLAIAAVGLAVTATLARRRLRSAAAPLLEDAVWLGGLAVAGATPATLAGIALAGGSTAVLLGGIWVAWGRGLAFAITARPDFQVFAPNPDNRYALGRIRVGADRAVGGVVAVVPDNGCRFTHVSLYDPRMRCVGLVPWPELRGAMAARGHLRVHVGPGDTDADVVFRVPPGRYYLTVRNYLARRPDAVALPRARAWDGAGTAPWSDLEDR